MRALAALALCLWSGSAAADDLSAFFGGQGCTIGPQSRRAALAEGISDAEIERFVSAARAAGHAVQQRDYIVLDAALCTIRLPAIATGLTTASPGIAALIVRRESAEHADDNGCFLDDPSAYFKARFPGEDGVARYLGFVGHGLVSGELRFHTPSILRTPYGFQVMTGECTDAAVATASPIDDRAFNAYTRARFEAVECDGPVDPQVHALSVALQGVDPGAKVYPTGVNAWRWFEFDLIGMGAGWIEGTSWRSRGEMRPPMCHYAAP